MELSPGLHFLHLLLFALWLGSDLGVFYASRVIGDPSLTPDARLVTARILLHIDQIPRLCLVLMLPTGMQLGATMGWLPLPSSFLSLLWVVCGAWIALVLSLHLYPATPLHTFLTRLDLLLRLLVVAGCVLAGWFLARADWLAWKLYFFALIVLCGLMIRVQLRPFGAALRQLHETPVPPEALTTLRRAIQKCRPFVFFIWFALLVNTALGRHFF